MHTVLFDEQAILDKVKTLAVEISRDYGEREFIIISVLAGACIFTADLLRELWRNGSTNCMVDFIGLSSYGIDRESSRNPHITKDIDIDFSNKDVLIVEDIVETGFSLLTLTTLLKDRGARSVKTVVLLDKVGKREVEFTPEYVGFQVPDEAWLEGYGLDTKYKGRGNPKLIIR
jgi:hypoxanthine phosphoribosyltransferase